VTAVVVILDRSLSMPMTDFFDPARGRAIELINDLAGPGCPDHLQALIPFGARASVTDPADLPDLEFDYEYGSNLDEALRLAVAGLAGESGRIVVISDLYVSAHTSEDGKVVFSWPPAQETLDRTREAIRLCKGASITLEAWRYRDEEATAQDVSGLVGASILDAGGTVEDVLIRSFSQGLDRDARYAG